MFEKEAEEIANKLCSERICYNHCNFSSPKRHRCGDWHKIYECAKAGAEIGFNKANEWHDLRKDQTDLPKEEGEYLVIFESDGTKYKGLESYYPDTKEWSTICNILFWKEIVLPKESE